MYTRFFLLPNEIAYKIYKYLPAHLLNRDITLVNKESHQLLNNKLFWLKKLKFLGIKEIVIKDNFWNDLDVKYIKLIFFATEKRQLKLNLSNLDLVHLCLINGHPEIINLFSKQYSVILNKELLRKILYTSNLKTLIYFCEQKKLLLPTNILTEAAIFNSDIEIVKYLVEVKNISPENDYAVKYAVKRNNLPVIRYLIKEKQINWMGEKEENPNYYLEFMRNLIQDEKIIPDKILIQEFESIQDIETINKLRQYNINVAPSKK